MGWDSSRPVPYPRLWRDWLLYAVVMVAAWALFLRQSTGFAGLVVGLVMSLPLWFALSYVLAKFGYQRQTLGEARAKRLAQQEAGDAVETTATGRPKPAPTKRTSTGHNRPPNRAKKRR